jgi:hypothetical protein
MAEILEVNGFNGYKDEALHRGGELAIKASDGEGKELKSRK